MRMLLGGSAASAAPAASVATSPAAASNLKSPHFVVIISSLYSERIGIRLVLDRHPLPAGEFLPIGGAADARAVAGRAGAAEGNMRLVGHRLVVNVQEPGAQPISERERAADRAREHAGGQAIFIGVGELHRL